MIIAIDGPSGAGKGTIAGYLALKFNLLHLDTGLLYRALAKAVLAKKLDPFTDSQPIAQMAQDMKLENVQDPDLRGEDIAAVASQIAIIEDVRAVLNDLQRQFCGSVKPPYQGAVLDGRDIGTVICPDATCKLFITARPEIRNQRRFLETSPNAQGVLAPAEKIAEKIAERDSRDSARKIAPLTPAPDAFIIDTSDLTIEQACAQAASYVAQRCSDQGISVEKPNSNNL